MFKKYKQEQSLKKRKNKYQMYINDANIIHKNKYSYKYLDLILPLNSKNKIECPEHGIFYQSFFLHKSGEGCPICSDLQKESKCATILKNAKVLKTDMIKEFVIKDNPNLKNKPYDIYCQPLNLIIEVQGEQHFKKKFGMTDNDLLLRKNIDKYKKDEAIKFGFNYLIIKKVSPINFINKLKESLESSTTIENLENNLKQFNSNEVEYIFNNMETESKK